MAQNLPLKAVNLGNWLVAEMWMEPSLFDGIPNNDLLDGTQIQLKSTKVNRYLTAENGGGSIVVANRESADDWETFRLWRISENTFNLRVFNKQFVQKDQNARAVAVNNVPGGWETFEIERKADDRNRVHIKASNGLYIQVKSDTVVTADYSGLGWEDSSPSVFIMTSVRNKLHGEYQLTNGLGPDRARQVLQEHRNTYITEEDFRFISSNGLNAVRIPVGWWIAFDPNPPKPFVGGSLPALDNAFSWAQKYGMKVIIDLHAAQGSQNGWEHSGTRDGYQEWGDAQISDTVAVIDFLAKRYANHPRLIAIELLNEPLAPGVNLDTLKSGLHHVVIDEHYYNLFTEHFKSLNVQQHIDFIYNQRSSNLGAKTTSNGPLSFVGEWTAEWDVQGATMQDYQRFAKAMLDVYGRATFGWAYWSYKNQYNHWSLK
ncbi:hypothetical protein TIFTF001_004296 [Ficus carica]|uniref:Mannan endo-1,4-beta-mannosidase n=1 Tax=Ficus carica TaxID=3494 RepID=A0AA88CVQ5_FICCA|nr:hypothetical protein TIFTF001_004296 [Ficus carica]